MIKIKDAKSIEIRIKQRIKDVLESNLDKIIDELIANVIEAKMERHRKYIIEIIKKELEKN